MVMEPQGTNSQPCSYDPIIQSSTQVNQTIPSLGSAFLFLPPEFASPACVYDTYRL